MDKQIQKHRSKNLFLSLLPDEEFRRLEPHLEPVRMEICDFVHKPYEKIQDIYFPENAIVSIVTFLEDGSSVETGIIGNEGVAGIGVILAEDVSTREATIQLAGDLLKLSAEKFKEEFARGGALNRLALRFVFAFTAQISQNIACVCHHQIEKRLSRWLLMVHDRIKGDTLKMTQEFIAQMLGVYRPTVTNCALKLQEQGLISYNHGRVTILNREGLENLSCECYRTIKESYDNFLKL